MKRERLIVLLGILVALVFFYIGLNEWLKTKEQQVEPPPVVVKPLPKEKEEPKEQPPQTTESEQLKVEQKPTTEPQKQDLIAQKIREEKKLDESTQKVKEKKKAKEEKGEKKVKEEPKPAKLKTYTVQVGAFTNKDGAEKVAQKARNMGYKVSIVEEDGFYKVRLSVSTADIDGELSKLKTTFGGAILK